MNSNVSSCTLTVNSGLEVLVKLYGNDFIDEFLSQMSYHHSEAIKMSKQIINMSKNRDVIREAQIIISSQTPQLERMIEWLNGWYNLGPNPRSKQLIKSDSCLIKHLDDKMNDSSFIIEMIQHHHIAHVMSLLLLQRISLEEFPDKAQQLRILANEIITSQVNQIERFLKLLK